MLLMARDLDYSAIMLNFVFALIELWRSLNFAIVGQIPNAAQLSNDQMVNAVIFYRCLTGAE